MLRSPHSSPNNPVNLNNMQSKPYTLFELNNIVRKSIELTLRDEYWVEAEISEVRENNGHCYMELVQKDERGNTPVARASAKCWRSVWQTIRPKFERITNMRLHSGMKVLLLVYPQFHEAYGFSWIVDDIDPTYTLGDMARRRQEIIKTLKEEGVFDLNRQIPLATFAQRIAVISSKTAAGYGDFCHQLEDNRYGFRFSITLFPAIMQGEGIEQSVISQLNEIYDRIDQYDCVVIIRGGGASSDLSGFDSLALAENIANFPLPVITGIGHDRDETVADMVAHTRVKTPTAAAAMLIDNLRRIADHISDMQQRISSIVLMTLQTEHQRLSRLSQIIPALFSVVSVRQTARVDNLAQRLAAAARNLIADKRSRLGILSSRLGPSATGIAAKETHRLEMLAQRASAVDPQLMLSRGYSITMTPDGKVVKDAATLAEGTEITTRLSKGEVKSIVTKS